jgi:FMN phosphatase YigB (HAD superfamily)
MNKKLGKNTYWHIFFDDGGVLNNNEIRGEQWKKLIPKYFLPRFGGTEQIWSYANHLVINEEMEKLEKLWIAKKRPEDFNVFWKKFMTDWVDQMFAYAGISLPEIDKIELFKDVSKFVIPQIRSANEGVKETLKILWERGYNLYTASGEVSWELKDYIIGMQCEAYFHDLYYGPDLINEGKLSPKFFTKVFQDVGIEPCQAILVDDNPFFLEYAKQAGANIIQSYINVQKRKVSDYPIFSFRDIPDMVEKITNR